MLEQAIDFRDECNVLFELLDPLTDADWNRRTQFKNWTINDVIAHLHMGDYMADLSLTDSEAFVAFMGEFMSAIGSGQDHMVFTHAWLKGAKNRELFDRWRGYTPGMSERFAAADPRMRVKWFGPDMSVRSSISARLMETWAHGQAVYDLLGKSSPETDRLKNIAVMGVNTFGWTFHNRGLEVPAEAPYVRLRAPSGEIWEWNEPSEDNAVAGSAVDFCRVVTQGRSIAEAELTTKGETARHWMSIAQCFAGPPEEPPAPGARYRQG